MAAPCLATLNQIIDPFDTLFHIVQLAWPTYTCVVPSSWHYAGTLLLTKLIFTPSLWVVIRLRNARPFLRWVALQILCLFFHVATGHRMRVLRVQIMPFLGTRSSYRSLLLFRSRVRTRIIFLLFLTRSLHTGSSQDGFDVGQVLILVMVLYEIVLISLGLMGTGFR